MVERFTPKRRPTSAIDMSEVMKPSSVRRMMATMRAAFTAFRVSLVVAPVFLEILLWSEVSLTSPFSLLAR